MGKQRILVVEDDFPIRRGIRQTLRFHGYEVVEAEDLAGGMTGLDSGGIDLVLLDLNLPDGDGTELLKRMRELQSPVPVIVLTARGEESDRVRGLRLGADDYVVKPFGALELAARVEAVLRRSPSRPEPPGVLELPGCRVDLGRRVVSAEGQPPRELTERESELLVYLSSQPGRAVSREEILARVWKLNPDAVETRTVDMTVARLRDKLGDGGAQPRIIQTLRGKGYLFSGEKA